MFNEILQRGLESLLLKYADTEPHSVLTVVLCKFEEMLPLILHTL